MTILTGLMRLGADAQLRHTRNGESVASLSLAFDYGRPGENGRRPTTWVKADLWGRRAEALTPYLRKGEMHNFVLDEVHLEHFTGQDGVPRTALHARVLDVNLAFSPKRAEQSPVQTQPPPEAPALATVTIAGQPVALPAAEANARNGANSANNEDADDIPF